MAKTATTKLVRTDTPGVYKRGKKYTYVYRVEGRQKWGTAPNSGDLEPGRVLRARRVVSRSV